MENKVYKNKNMIRTKHNVVRIIYFESELERERFIMMYGDLFDYSNKFEHDNEIGIAIKTTVQCFNEIAKSIGLINVVKTNWKKTRYWKTENALV